MVSAWDVYLVMQLDTIGAAAVVMTIVVGAFAALIGSFYLCEREQVWPSVLLFFLWLPLPLTATFLPSSKTAAAMILIPKLTSPEVLQPAGAEARELYDLAKQALRKVAQDEKPAEGDQK